MEQSKVSNDENFTKELDFQSQELVNTELLRKTRKVGIDKDEANQRKASHQRFMKNINESFIKANGVGLSI